VVVVPPEGMGIDSCDVAKGRISSLYNARKIPMTGV